MVESKITYDNMDWHELGMRERERKRAVVWGLVGLVRGAECGRTALPGQILCPRDLWLSAFFGGRSLWTERVPEGENVWFPIDLCVEVCGFITLEQNRTRSTLLFETTEGRPNVGHCIITLICLESDNWTCLNHLSFDALHSPVGRVTV